MIAHIRADGVEETVTEHCNRVAETAAELGKALGLEKLAYLTGYLHDIGKYTKKFEQYIRTVAVGDIWKESKLNHSSAGGKYIYERFGKGNRGNQITAKMIAWCIFSHHGVQDIISVDQKDQFQQRVNPEKDIFYEEAKGNFEKYMDVDIDELFEAACEEVHRSFMKLEHAAKETNQADKMSVGVQFSIGLLMRLNLSILVESDYRETAAFMGEVYHPVFSISSIWKKCQKNLIDFVGKFPENRLSQARSCLFQTCICHARQHSGIFTMEIPTGGGKTVDSMIFALTHAIENGQKRIFYIAPYKNILIQNAQVLRVALNDEDVILEYHSDLIVDYAEEDDTKKLYMEGFQMPIVLTTMVQFLNALFSGKMQSVRRTNAFTDSVIVIDEVQSMPIKCIHLFNLAMNFLREFHTTIILCTATQPTFHKVEYPIFIDGKVIKNAGGMFDKFKRTEILDYTHIHRCEKIADLAVRQIETSRSGLIIVNTKKVCKQIYDTLADKMGKDVVVLHLSTNMCPQHRLDILERFKKLLKEKKRTVCVSTQLIEAGVDISAEWVIRSVAGWDSVIQAAGRCNRNGEMETGYVYVVDCREEELGQLPDIYEGRKISFELLANFRENPQNYDSDLGSLKFIKAYYQKYYFRRMKDMSYSIREYDTSILDLLSFNSVGTTKRSVDPFTYAFGEAGRQFEVIAKDTQGIIVPYGEGKKMIQQLCNSCYDIGEIRNRLKQAQRYTINVYSNYLHKYQEDGIVKQLECGAYCLLDNYYDIHVGVNETKELAFLCI